MATVSTLIAEGAERLSAGPHPERARMDAEALLLHLLGVNKAWRMTHGADAVSEDSAARYAAWVERRFFGEPIQYITGEAEFYGLPFCVTPDVLIPRPETEHLVERAITLAGGWDVPRIVDIGSGSGAIPVALAHSLPAAHVTSIDLSENALAVARGNAVRNELSERVHFLHGDLLAPVAQERFELVVSNPPYIPETDRETLSVEVREHEPEMALFAGVDGLEIYRRLVPEAYAVLVDGGWLLLEIGFGQEEAIRSLMVANGFQGVQFIADLQGIARVACGQR